LLNGRYGAINQDKLDLGLFENNAEFFDLAFTEQHPSMPFWQTDGCASYDFNVRQCRSKGHSLFERGNRIPAGKVGFQVWVQDPSPRGELIVFLQSYSSPSYRLIG
jgi:hypothetical protein